MSSKELAEKRIQTYISGLAAIEDVPVGNEPVKSKDIPQEIRSCGQVTLFKQDPDAWRMYYEEQLEIDQAQVEKDNRVLEATKYMLYAIHDLVRLRTR